MYTLIRGVKCKSAIYRIIKSWRFREHLAIWTLKAGKYSFIYVFYILLDWVFEFLIHKNLIICRIWRTGSWTPLPSSRRGNPRRQVILRSILSLISLTSYISHLQTFMMTLWIFGNPKFLETFERSPLFKDIWVILF